MTTELYLSTHDQLLTLLVLLLLLVIMVFYRKPKTAAEEQERAPEQETELNPDYGRYIWLAGRYYN